MPDDRDVFVIGLVLLVLIAALFSPLNAEASLNGCYPGYYADLSMSASIPRIDNDGNVHVYVCDEVSKDRHLKHSGIVSGLIIKRLVCGGKTLTLWAVHCNET